MLSFFNRVLISLILAMVTVPCCFAQSNADKINRINKQLESYEHLIAEESSKPNPSFGLRLGLEEDRIPDLSSYYNSTDSIPTNMGVVYNKGLNYILSGKDKKAYQYFEKLLKKKNVSITNKDHAAYQLAHYDWYNCFDKYYNGLPSNMPREKLTSVVAKDKRYGFRTANRKTCLLMCANPQLPSYNLEYVVDRGSYILHSPENHEEELFGKSVFYTACDTALTCSFSLYEIYHKYYDWGIFFPGDLSHMIRLSKTLPYLSRMKQSSPTSDIGKTARELYTTAEEFRKSKDYVNACYHYVRAALFGDTKSFVQIYETLDEQIKNFYSPDEKNAYGDLVILGYDLAETILEHKEFAEHHDLAKKVYESRKQIKNDYDKRKRDTEIAQKEARRQRRLQFWSGVLQSAVQSVNSTINQMAMVQQSPFTSVQNPVRTNMDHLIDLRYTIAQSNVKEYQEYQAVREEYQRMGKDLTIDEWRTMQGQAIMNLKNQGYDIIAEQRKINEDNKAFNEQMRQRERQDRLKQYNAQLGGGSSVVSNSTITSQNHKTTSNTTMDVSTTKQEVGRTNTEKLDSKEQYKRERVASDDYHFVKHVNLYIRDGNTNRVKFSNKDLCEKGSRYYIKINNMYYLVQTNGGWGFNSSILYSHSKLYFNK